MEETKNSPVPKFGPVDNDVISFISSFFVPKKCGGRVQRSLHCKEGIAPVITMSEPTSSSDRCNYKNVIKSKQQTDVKSDSVTDARSRDLRFVLRLDR